MNTHLELRINYFLVLIFIFCRSMDGTSEQIEKSTGKMSVSFPQRNLNHQDLVQHAYASRPTGLDIFKCLK